MGVGARVEEEQATLERLQALPLELWSVGAKRHWFVIEPREVTGRRSDYSLYDYGLATYDAADSFRHEDSAGFVRLWGLGLETWASKRVAQDGQVDPTTPDMDAEEVPSP